MDGRKEKADRRTGKENQGKNGSGEAQDSL
jgi:hypothetical protein